MGVTSPAKRRVILDAARGLLVRRGYQDVALDDIAKEADVAKGTLYLYFKNKDQLFSAAFEDLVAALGEQLDALLASDKRGDALLKATAVVLLDHFDRHHDFLSRFGAGSFPACGARSAGKLMEKLDENVGRVASLLKRVPGAANHEDMKYAALAFVGLCRAAMLKKLLDRASRPLAAEADMVTEMFLHGVGGRR